MTRRALVEQGYEVEACSTLAEANEAFKNTDEHFDAVLSDVVLPDGRGPDLVTDLIKRQPNLAALLVKGIRTSAETGSAFNLRVLSS